MDQSSHERRIPEHRHGCPAWGQRDAIHETPVWDFDPVALSLEASAWRDPTDLGNPFCAEVGRRLLLAQLQGSEWILRRVEKLDMSALEGVRRSITLEFLVPPDAPRFRDSDGRWLRCVPLSLMRRRTLIGLDIRDEQGGPITMPGIRVTQRLDQSLLLAAAASSNGVDPDAAAAPREEVGRVLDWIRRAVSGRRDDVRNAYEELDGEHPARDFPGLRGDPLFMDVANRLRHNFTLYLFLDEALGRRRLINISFQEPSDWRYQTPKLRPPTAAQLAAGATDSTRYYEAGRPRFHVRGALARLGLIPQRIRFQVPGADYAASYHFELAAPPGVRIVRATLLAGRPNDPERHVSLDDVRGHVPTVGLHAVEVPNGSLCRVQADLCLAARGYLGTMLVANIAIVLLLLVVVAHTDKDSALETDVVTNVILFLVSAVAAAAALVAQGDVGGLSARFVSGVRVLTTAALGFPVVAAVFLTFNGHHSSLTSTATAFYILRALCAAAAVILAITLWAWLNSWLRERARLLRESPWDMTRLDPQPPEPRNFTRALEECNFHSSAVGVASAEGWHSVYSWSDALQYDAINRLESGSTTSVPAPGSRRLTCHELPSTCAGRPGSCPSAIDSANHRPAT